MVGPSSETLADKENERDEKSVKEIVICNAYRNAFRIAKDECRSAPVRKSSAEGQGI